MKNRQRAWRLMAASALAVLLGSAAVIPAKVVHRRVVVHHPGGAVHYGGRPGVEVRRVGPPGTIRHEHWEHRDFDRFRVERPFEVGRPYHEVFRVPYEREYIRRFPLGYRTIVVGPNQYYAYPYLPAGYRPIVINGVTYYLAGGVYYQPYLYEGQTMYLAVPPP
jgi:hypothetical protein